MSATSGIGVSPELVQEFASAVDSKSTRFIKVSILNESLVHDLSVPVGGSLDEDLVKLQEHNILEDHTPTYLLIRLDDPSSDWLAVFYVPDSAKVRDKMLYASTRASLLKSLGSTVFTDSLFATSKSDLTPDAYQRHKRHIAAPKPLSAREQEMADLRAAEREAGVSYEGSQARQNHIGTGVGLHWFPEVEDAVKKLGQGEGSSIVIIKIDTISETLLLDSVSDITVESLGSTIPSSDPCYVFFAWPHAHSSPPRREIIFIYSCPSSSAIKHRMVYSSGASSVFLAAKSLLSPSSSSSVLTSRKIETSDPREIDEEYLISELGLGNGGSVSKVTTPSVGANERKPFAKPRGPMRKK